MNAHIDAFSGVQMLELATLHKYTFLRLVGLLVGCQLSANLPAALTL